ncbi:hypothetical protein CesoFtcFv8_010967 [Champsocephalus esox]|uniref:Uncharacterized protein n=1 Tax=Champsocephalus esox TaxID=159716 RepID=A0AAN8BYL2_9TELE|nr:hypothetical protein CesoFtcFv8_010967 [Champsocephalus esox]
MADNKGEDDMESSANSDAVPSAQDNEQPETKEESAVIVPEANTKVGEETESQDTVNEAPTPTSDGGDVSNGGAVVEGGEANGSTSNSPAKTSTTNAEPTAAETLPAVDAPVGGPSSEMSPPCYCSSGHAGIDPL